MFWIFRAYQKPERVYVTEINDGFRIMKRIMESGKLLIVRHGRSVILKEGCLGNNNEEIYRLYGVQTQVTTKLLNYTSNGIFHARQAAGRCE